MNSAEYDIILTRIIDLMQGKLDKYKVHPQAKPNEIGERETLLTELKNTRTAFQDLARGNTHMQAVIIDFVDSVTDSNGNREIVIPEKMLNIYNKAKQLLNDSSTGN